MRLGTGIALIAAVLLVTGFHSVVHAQAKYPSKPVQLIVAYGPGGAQDIFWRSIREDLEKHLRGTINVVNKPGSSAGIKITHVPNANATDAIANVLGGHVDFWLGSLPGILPLAKAGKLRVLGFTGDQRLPDIPELPTFAEQGVPQANIDFTAALMGPKNLPQEVYSAWQGAIKTVLGNPERQANLRKSSMYVKLELDREKINQNIKEQYDKITQIVAKEGIRVN